MNFFIKNVTRTFFPRYYTDFQHLLLWYTKIAICTTKGENFLINNTMKIIKHNERRAEKGFNEMFQIWIKAYTPYSVTYTLYWSSKQTRWTITLRKSIYYSFCVFSQFSEIFFMKCKNFFISTYACIFLFHMNNFSHFSLIYPLFTLTFCANCFYLILLNFL